MMTRRWLIKVLVGLPFIGSLLRQRLMFNAWDEYVYLRSEGLSEFQALSVLAPYLQNKASANDAATQMLISQATSYGFLVQT